MGSDSKDTDIHLSGDRKLDRLLKTVVNDVNAYAMDQIRHMRRLSDIGMALSLEKNINALFDMIVDEGRRFCDAEAGTLYIVDREKQSLRFEVLQNEVLHVGMNSPDGEFTDLPDVPLYIGQEPNHSNVSSYVALTGRTVNIPDIYHITETDEAARTLNFSGAKAYDARTGYRTQSMLVIPMKNHEAEVIGVLQLINARDDISRRIGPFSDDDVDMISSLASQAAVALTNAQLVQDLKSLFYAFLRSIAAAIDEKSAYTGGHIRRVVDLTMMIASAVNESVKTPFAGFCLDGDQMEELRISAWMHDVGKITTPEHVVDKSARLETIFDRIALVETRFALIAKSIENRYLEEKLQIAVEGCGGADRFDALDRACAEKVAALQADLDFIRSCNTGTAFMDHTRISRIREISGRRFQFNGKPAPYLTENETANLCIPKGTLTDAERKMIEHHAKMTYEITRRLPFPQKMARVPEYAASHHEKPNGRGYPNGCSGDRLSLQSRILAIADIFEALTARDRPYKKPMTLSRAVKILEQMKADNQIDADVFDLFLDQRIHLAYARKEMDPEQIDL